MNYLVKEKNISVVKYINKDFRNLEKALKNENQSIIKAIKLGYSVCNSSEAHIVNSFGELFNNKLYLNGNKKTGVIPVYNLPNIKVQKDFLNVLENNYELFKERIPKSEKQNFFRFMEYLKNNPMCVNCEKCSKNCYNNTAYNTRPNKSICDLRQLYKLVNDTENTIAELKKATKNYIKVRLNGSGEIHNSFILDSYIKIAKANKDTIFYTYTKNFELLKGKKLPKNLVINLSDFGNREKLKSYRELLPKNLNTYITLNKEEFLKLDKKELKCNGGVDACFSCGLCTKKLGKNIYVKIH